MGMILTIPSASYELPVFEGVQKLSFMQDPDRFSKSVLLNINKPIDVVYFVLTMYERPSAQLEDLVRTRIGKSVTLVIPNILTLDIFVQSMQVTTPGSLANENVDKSPLDFEYQIGVVGNQDYDALETVIYNANREIQLRKIKP